MRKKMPLYAIEGFKRFRVVVLHLHGVDPIRQARRGELDHAHKRGLERVSGLYPGFRTACSHRVASVLSRRFSPKCGDLE